nr:fluoride efflux transporter CrcB [Planctomycetaceae bacterium]
MTPPVWTSIVAVAGGGACGALCRYAVGLLMLRWHPEAGPLGTLGVN